ncbi:ABC transporter substrate-binding protein [Pseudonocardia sp.]|uniref:ABC transporter substrate-binding protein n=1 Tax=Pseudonocardia sp. TaxID=60912 RepID=UPI003D0E4636
MFVRRLPSVVTVAALAAVLAGCGAGGDGSGAAGGAAPTSAAPVPAVTSDPALAAQVPDSVKSDGKLVFGTDASYPPNEFTASDGTTIIGMDVDLGNAIAQKLGLTGEFVNSSFDGILPGIGAGTYEAGMSSFSINDERVQVVDMVSYYSAGTSVGVRAGNPDGVVADDLCGKAIGVQRGTVQVEDLAARNEKCAAEGKPAITVSEFQLQTDVNLALASGRVVAMLADSPVVGYAAQQTNGQLEALGEPYDAGPYGIALGKNQGDFPKAVQGAIQALIADGTYQAILEKWGVANGAITTSEIRS